VRVLPIALIVCLAAWSGACAKARAHTDVPLPVLTPPEAPPRNIDTYADEPVPTVEPPSIDAALTPPPPRPATRPPAPRPEPPKTEPARTEPIPPVAAPPALTLKPAPGTENKTEASIRELMGRAARDLNRVHYAALDADGRAQYDTARRFIDQAEEAMKSGNLAFAGKLADKAATMALVLIR
jgi:hypothetical protein